MERAGHAGRLTAELLAFYGDEGGRTTSGYTLGQVLGWPDGEWEDRHDFIQWVFPTDEPSMRESGRQGDAGVVGHARCRTWQRTVTAAPPATRPATASGLAGPPA